MLYHQNTFVIICYMDLSAKASNSRNDNYIGNGTRNFLSLVPKKGLRRSKKWGIYLVKDEKTQAWILKVNVNFMQCLKNLESIAEEMHKRKYAPKQQIEQISVL